MQDAMLNILLGVLTFVGEYIVKAADNCLASIDKQSSIR
jgi:hypothetical protein